MLPAVLPTFSPGWSVSISAWDLKQAVIVENKAGAQGAIGAEAVARSEPDGYTAFRHGGFDLRAQSDAVQEAALRPRQGISDAGTGD
jgi:hypothetical protein